MPQQGTSPRLPRRKGKPISTWKPPAETGTTETGLTSQPTETDQDKLLSDSYLKSRALIVREAAHHFDCFLPSVLRDETNQTYISLQPHQYEWIDHIVRCEAAGKFPGILAPPSSGKSQIFSIGYPLFKMGRNPEIRMAICASDDDLVKARVGPTKEYVQYNPDYRAIFPNVLPEHPDKWTAQAFVVKRPRGIKDPTYQGRGVMTPPQGSRLDLVINDDICTYKNTISEPAMRQKVIDSWYNGFDYRLGPESPVIHIGGIIHSRDLNVRLMNDPRFWFIKQSISDDFSSLEQDDMRTGEKKRFPLWDRAWTPEFLRKKYESNPRAYKRAYKHIGYSDEERTFPEASVRAAIRTPIREFPASCANVIGVDLSGKERKGNVITVVSPLERRVVREIMRGAWTSTETARQILRLREKYNAAAIVVENNAYQSALLDWIKVVTPDPIPIYPFTTGKQKADEVLGLPGLSAEFENGMWEIPFEEGHVVAMGCDCAKCKLVDELINHPFGESDCVMSLWFARHGIVHHAGPATIEFVQGPGIGRGQHEEREVGGRLAAFRRSRRGR